MRDEGRAWPPGPNRQPCTCGHTKEQHHKTGQPPRWPARFTNCWLCGCKQYLASEPLVGANLRSEKGIGSDQPVGGDSPPPARLLA